MFRFVSGFFANWRAVALAAAITAGGLGYVIVLRAQLDVARVDLATAELRADLAASNAAALQAAADKMRGQAVDLAASQERADAARRAAERRLAAAADQCLDQPMPVELMDKFSGSSEERK